MELFLTVCVTSVTLGLLYSLFALGLGVVLRTSGQLNLAHGDSLMLATYVGLGTSTAVGVSALGILAAVAAGAAIGAVAHLAVYAPVASRRKAGLAGLGFLPALGVALIVRNVAIQADPEGSSPFPSLFAGGRVNLFGDYRLPAAGWWLLGAGIVVPVVVALVLRHTVVGRRIRAVADEPVLARLNGVPVTRTLASAYALAGIVGGLAGVLFASFFGQVFVALGWQATLKGFVAAVLGGLGWVRGAVLGGLALGFVESFVSGYLSTRFRDVATFALLIAVLLLLPRGVLAGGRLRSV
ncbi:MAG: branched-chain amino acid transport system permease protein [Actinomycetota bacterium]|jgi:branched-chain amino acid transport system permease protein|nr:branched-chain amino acid transport system permease protein [Actinomycetota bacterium]MEA2972097.1 branched-chain amino acid transport system permease protein [Actinomycetota bacterium]